MRSTDRMIRTPRARWQHVVALGAVAVLALGACGGDDDDDAAGDDTTEVTEAPDDNGETSDTTAAGDTGTELHEFVAFAIPETETCSGEELLSLPEEEVMTAVTPVNGFAFAVPDGTFYTTFNFETPGRHGAVCFIPVGLTPEALESGEFDETAPPHHSEGMFKEFEVTA